MNKEQLANADLLAMKFMKDINDFAVSNKAVFTNEENILIAVMAAKHADLEARQMRMINMLEKLGADLAALARK